MEPRLATASDHPITLRLLREDGWMKVRAGLTTPEEVARATKA